MGIADIRVVDGFSDHWEAQALDPASPIASFAGQKADLTWRLFATDDVYPLALRARGSNSEVKISAQLGRPIKTTRCRTNCRSRWIEKLISAICRFCSRRRPRNGLANSMQVNRIGAAYRSRNVLPRENEARHCMRSCKAISDASPQSGASFSNPTK